MFKQYGNSKGYTIIFINNQWVYSDNLNPAELEDRPCRKCGLKNNDSYDICLGKLNGAKNACCGHGNLNFGYISFNSGLSIHFRNGILGIHINNKNLYKDEYQPMIKSIRIKNLKNYVNELIDYTKLKEMRKSLPNISGVKNNESL